MQNPEVIVDIVFVVCITVVVVVWLLKRKQN